MGLVNYDHFREVIYLHVTKQRSIYRGGRVTEVVEL